MSKTPFLKATKAQVIAAVIKDVPVMSSDEIRKEAQKLIDADVMTYAPPEVAYLWANKMRSWLTAGNPNLGQHLGHAYLRERFNQDVWGGGINFEMPGKHVTSKSCNDKLLKLVKRYNADTEKLEQMRSKLVSALHPIRTVEGFEERFPELKQYLPKSVATPAMLPAVVNVMDDLVALGWPAPRTEEVAEEVAA